MINTFEHIAICDATLQHHHVDLWEYPLAIEYPEAKGFLDDDERLRAKRYHFSRHQRRFTLARAGLRLILAHYLNCLPNALAFTYTTHGKPELKHTPLHFNLSHSKDLALLAVASQHPLGADVEYVSVRPYDGLSRMMFSKKEQLALFQAPSMAKPWLFFHIWAQKEAFIKASGLGLSYPTQTFDVPTLSSVDTILYDERHRTSWRMLSFMPNIACHAALCCHPSTERIRYVKLTDMSELL